METQMQSDLLDRDATCRFFGGTRPINPATLYRGVRKGRYPKPVKVGPGSSRWLRAECEAALAQMAEGRAEDRELKRRREEIKSELEALGENAKDRWYHQEYEREFAENARKAERQRQLRAKDEERKRRVNDRLANMTPEARAKWNSIIGGAKESSPEEIKHD